MLDARNRVVHGAPIDLAGQEERRAAERLHRIVVLHRRERAQQRHRKRHIERRLRRGIVEVDAAHGRIARVFPVQQHARREHPVGEVVLIDRRGRRIDFQIGGHQHQRFIPPVRHRPADVEIRTVEQVFVDRQRHAIALDRRAGLRHQALGLGRRRIAEEQRFQQAGLAGRNRKAAQRQRQQHRRDHDRGFDRAPPGRQVGERAPHPRVKAVRRRRKRPLESLSLRHGHPSSSIALSARRPACIRLLTVPAGMRSSHAISSKE